MRKLNAKVFSFDYDQNSVQATAKLRETFYAEDPDWVVEQGSVLDEAYLSKLGTFDIVYSWGVLHHTGDMWSACQNVVPLVKPNGLLYIAIYNNSGPEVVRWKKLKAMYNKSVLGKLAVSGLCIPYFFLLTLFLSIKKRQNIFRTYRKNRGMSIYHDWIDWIGGYPYEYAKVSEVFQFFHDRGFNLTNIGTTQSFGCNEFVFVNSK
jgi:2-polyprenyl-6-hydroxyphenyl methylase/3-demethylubiquinone-9 3-methyltransferase